MTPLVRFEKVSPTYGAGDAVRGWLTGVRQFAILFEDRFTPIEG